VFKPFVQQYFPLPPLTQQSGYEESEAPFEHFSLRGGIVLVVTQVSTVLQDGHESQALHVGQISLAGQVFSTTFAHSFFSHFS
jgi:hypothetical protein